MISVKIVRDNVHLLEKVVEELAKAQVLVGIPAKNSERDTPPEGDEEGLSNPELGYLHEFGDPAHKIPARPFLVPGVTAVKDKLIEILKKAGEKAIEGNEEAMQKEMMKAGEVAVASVRKQFVSNNWKSLSNYTLERRRERGFKGTRPLIETGQLRKSITYVVTKVED